MDERLRELERLSKSEPTYSNTSLYISALLRSGNTDNILLAIHLGTPSVFLNDGSLLIRVNARQASSPLQSQPRHFTHWIIAPDFNTYTLSQPVANLLSGVAAFEPYYPEYNLGDPQINPIFCHQCGDNIDIIQYDEEQWGYFYYAVAPDEEVVALHGNIQTYPTGHQLPDGCLKEYLDNYVRQQHTFNQQQELIDQNIQNLLHIIPNNPDFLRECRATDLLTSRHITQLVESGHLADYLDEDHTPHGIATIFLTKNTSDLEKLAYDLNLSYARYFYDVRVDSKASRYQDHYVIELPAKKEDNYKRKIMPIPELFGRDGMLSLSASAEIKNHFNHKVEGMACFKLLREINYDYLTIQNKENKITIPIDGLHQKPNRAWLKKQRTEELYDEIYYPLNWPLNWSITTALNELATFAESRGPDPDDLIAANDKIINMIQTIIASLVENAGYEPDEYERLHDQSLDFNIEIERDYDTEHLPGIKYCSPCFMVVVTTVDGIRFYTDAEIVAKALDVVGVTQEDWWIIEVARQIDLTDAKYWANW